MGDTSALLLYNRVDIRIDSGDVVVQRYTTTHLLPDKNLGIALMHYESIVHFGELDKILL